jgi:hypothetical protein
VREANDAVNAANSSGPESADGGPIQGALPAKASLPRITGLSTAFPFPEDADVAERRPHRMGEDRGPRRHASGE